MGVTDLATNFDLMSATKQVVMQEDRDFTFPREPAMANDIHSADDKLPTAIDDAFIKQVQGFMSGKPLGTGYSGGITGKITQPLLSALIDLEVELSKKTGKPTIGSIVNGLNINKGGFWAAVKDLGGQQAKPTSAPEVSSSEIIKSFQSFLSTAKPVIGAPYQGPVDGIPSPALAAAAKAVESAIAKATGNSSAMGMLWNDNKKTFNTTTNDLNEALNLIIQHGKKQAADLANIVKTPRYEALLRVATGSNKKDIT